jgi:hypothetical protein
MLMDISNQVKVAALNDRKSLELMQLSKNKEDKKDKE